MVRNVRTKFGSDGGKTVTINKFYILFYNYSIKEGFSVSALVAFHKLSSQKQNIGEVLGN